MDITMGRRTLGGSILACLVFPWTAQTQACVLRVVPATMNEAVASLDGEGLVSLVGGAVDASGMGCLWKSRYHVWTSAAVRAGYARHARDGIPVTLERLEGMLGFQDIQRASQDMLLTQDLQDGCQRWLERLPGYEKTRGMRQQQITLDQHGYCQMMVTGLLHLLGDSDAGLVQDVANGRVDWLALAEKERASWGNGIAG